MFTRVLAILSATANRESARLDLALTRAVFLIIAAIVLLPATAMSRGTTPIVPDMLGFQFGISMYLMIFLAVRLGGDSVGDVRCGMLELLFLSDTKPWHWLLVRVAQMWIAFLSVWIVRAPLLILVQTFGGLRTETILVSELLLMTGFLFLSSLSLLVSFKAGSRRQVFGFVLGGLLLWEFLFMAPGIVTGVLTRYYNWPVAIQTVAAMQRIEAIGLASCYRFAILRPMVLTDCWPVLAVYGGLTALILTRFHRMLRVHAGGIDMSPRAHDEAPHRSRQRVSRRCWDDALAWQAFTIHGGGRRLVLWKCIGVILFASTMWYLAERGFGESAFIISVAGMCGMLLLSMNKTGDCLSREIKEKTLTMLLLTPNGPDDYYAGWQRGAWRLAWPEVVLGAGVTIASIRLDPAAPAILISVVAALLSSAPFLMLSPLVPFSARGIATGTILIAGLMGTLGLCVAVGVGVSTAAVPLVSIPAVLIYNQCLRRLLLPYWIQEKIDSIV